MRMAWQDTLHISNIDQTTGEVFGNFGVGDNPTRRFGGIWDETSRTLTFRCTLSGPGQQAPESQQIYKGLLFNTPRNPAPGQDVVWTLAGFVQYTDLSSVLGSMGGNARRNVFGWFAQIPEVA